MTNSIDIKAKAPFPAGALSNFAPHAFTFDGIACASMEGLLQSARASSACARDLKNSAQKRQGLVARNQSARSRHGSIFQ